MSLEFGIKPRKKEVEFGNPLVSALNATLTGAAASTAAAAAASATASAATSAAIALNQNTFSSLSSSSFYNVPGLFVHEASDYPWLKTGIQVTAAAGTGAAVALASPSVAAVALTLYSVSWTGLFSTAWSKKETLAVIDKLSKLPSETPVTGLPEPTEQAKWFDLLLREGSTGLTRPDLPVPAVWPWKAPNSAPRKLLAQPFNKAQIDTALTRCWKTGSGPLSVRLVNETHESAVLAAAMTYAELVCNTPWTIHTAGESMVIFEVGLHALRTVNRNDAFLPTKEAADAYDAANRQKNGMVVHVQALSLEGTNYVNWTDPNQVAAIATYYGNAGTWKVTGASWGEFTFESNDPENKETRLDVHRPDASVENGLLQIAIKSAAHVLPVHDKETTSRWERVYEYSIHTASGARDKSCRVRESRLATTERRRRTRYARPRFGCGPWRLSAARGVAGGVQARV
jgi:hypothetical protein